MLGFKSLLDGVVNQIVLPDRFFTGFDHCLLDKRTAQVQVVSDGSADYAIHLVGILGVRSQVIPEGPIHAGLEGLAASNLS